MQYLNPQLLNILLFWERTNLLHILCSPCSAWKYMKRETFPSQHDFEIEDVAKYHELFHKQHIC